MRATERSALRHPSLWLLATAVVTVAPHAPHLPAWVGAACAGLLTWHGWRVWQGAQGGRWLRWGLLVLAIVGTAAVRAEFGYFFGKTPGMALLALLLCLKLLEGGTSRDVRVGVLLALFLQLGLFFNDQTLPVAAQALTGVLLATATLFALEDPGGSPQRMLRGAGLLIAQAVPFLLVLFVLFPRVPGPLWGMPEDAHASLTGLSDEMFPGAIAELGLSDAIALRASFSGPPPPPAQRYWRGPVLSEFDGRTWRMGPTTLSPTPPYTPSGPALDYVLTVEPHNRRWLLALDFAETPPGTSNLRYASDYQLLADQPIRSRTQFALRARPQTEVGLDESAAVLDRAIALPEASNPRTRRLVAELIADEDSPRAALEKVLDHLRAEALTYTLAPPPFGEEAVDGFLFDARRGFCEHFSSAFVFMMRAAGVPARVVTGYQGGTVNPIDGSLIVRQSDAHAWAEVWLPNEGWVRVDPTALAAPERISEGLRAALPAGDPRPLLMREGRGLDLLRAMRDRWEAMSNVWNRNVLAYDYSRQRKLLTQIGMAGADVLDLALALSAAIGSLMLALVGWTLLRRPRGDALDRLWGRFGRKLARRGLARLPSEGPIDYAERVASALPGCAAEARSIASLYGRLRYGAPDDRFAQGLRELAQRIRKFSPT